MNTDRVVDVAILGAGPAGASLAIALSQAGYDTVLLHRPARAVARVGTVHETLSGTAKTALQSLGVWQRFQQLAPLASTGTVSRWRQDRFTEAPAFSTALGSGWHVARPAFDALLRAHARQSGARVRLVEGLRDIVRTGAQVWRLRFSGEDDVVASFVVDASGRHRVLARRLGAISSRQDDLLGLIASVPTGALALSGKLWITAQRDGWCYALPTSDGGSTIAVMTDPATVRTLGLRTPRQWAEAVSRTSLPADLVHSMSVPARVHRKLAGVSRAIPSGGANWLAVGDAALSFDPLAGHGLTQALRDGMRGADVISHWLNGAHTPLHQHLRMQHAAYDHHLRQKRAYYQLVARWTDRPFWQSRCGHQVPDQDMAIS